MYWPRPPRAAIVIDPRLSAVEQTAALAHELIHDERGGGTSASFMPATWDPIEAREEARVRREVARRLVPLDELGALAERRAELGESVGATVIAEEFDVPDPVAEDALRLLLSERPLDSASFPPRP